MVMPTLLTDLLLAGMSAGQLRERAEAALQSKRLAPFVRAAFSARYPSKRLKWNWHHDAICDHLEACTTGDITRLLINVPPRNLKSFIVSVCWPAWWWLQEPHKQFLCVSADRDVVYRDADALRDLVATGWYQDAFRPQWGFKTDHGNRQQDAKGYYRNTAGGHRISKAIGAKAQGVDADVVIFDDILDAEDAYNDKAPLRGHVVAARQKFMTRHNDNELGVVVAVMQRLHQLDFSGVMIDEGGWEAVILPAEHDGVNRYTSLGQYDPRTEPGELLDATRMPKVFLEERERMLGPRGYAGQYLQRPAAAKGAIVHKGWLQYWTPESLPEMDYILSSWDLTKGSQTEDADYVVGQVWGVRGLDRYLLDQVRQKLSTDQMVDAILEMQTHWPTVRHTIIEEKAAGKDVADTVREQVPGVETYDPQDTSKEQRLAATVLMWRDGNIWLPHYAKCSSLERDYSWVRDDYVPEIVTFPGSSHDDQVDATSQVLLWLRENGYAHVTDTVKVIG